MRRLSPTVQTLNWMQFADKYLKHVAIQDNRKFQIQNVHISYYGDGHIVIL